MQGKLPYSYYSIGLLSGLFWGAAAVAYGILHSEFPQSETFEIIILVLFSIDFIGFVFSGASVMASANKATTTVFKSVYSAIFAGILAGPVATLSYLQSIQNLGAGYSAVISSTYPIWGALLSIFLLKEYLNKINLFGFSLVILCSFLLGLQAVSSSAQGWFGVICALIAALGWGIEIAASSYAMLKLTANQVYFFRQLAITLGYFIILLQLDINISTIVQILNTSKFIILLALIIILSISSYWLYYHAIYLLRPVKAMALNSTYSLWALLIGSFWYGERLNTNSLILACIIFSGIILTIYQEKR